MHIYTTSIQKGKIIFSLSSTFWLLNYEVSTFIHLELSRVLPTVFSREALDFFPVQAT